MGKIDKKATEKHEATLSPAIAAFITTTVTLPLYQLRKHLESFSKRWPFPRGDIYHWIDALNRFDGVLEQFNSHYGLDEAPQTRDFGREVLIRGDTQADKPEAKEGTDEDSLNQLGFSVDGDRELVETIIRFSKLIFENCGNRSLYASTNRLSDLLNTTSLSLLDVTLRMGLRCAQRYSASRLRIGAPYLQTVHQGLLATHYRFDLSKVENLAQPFIPAEGGKTQQKKVDTRKGELNEKNGFDLLTMLQDKADSEIDWQQYGDVRIDLRDDTSAEQGRTNVPEQSTPSFQTPATPTPARWANQVSASTSAFEQDDKEEAVTNGVLYVKHADILSTSSTAMVRSNIADVPKNLQYQYLHKLRVARALTESPESRSKITQIRILAIANLSHIYAEQQLDQKVLQQDLERPRRFQLAHQLCDVIHPPGKGIVPAKGIQALALETLDALCNHKNKVADVATALGVSVSHGTFTYIVRKVLNDDMPEIGAADDLEDREWRRALATLLHTLPKSSPRSGEGFLSAGLVEILIKAIARRSARAEEDHPTLLNFTDVFTYNTQHAFDDFVNAKGLEELASLLDHEVSMALSLVEQGKGMPAEYKTAMTDYEIPFDQQQTLRALVKFLNHSMGFSGQPIERMLRNMIESSTLLGGIRTIISKPHVFGTNVWSAAVNVFGSFIHNEPTSYAAIAEAGLVKTFLETITQQPLREGEDTPPEAEDTSKGILFAIDNLGKVKMDDTANHYGSAAAFQKGVLASIECIAAMPQALSAICLNEAGIQQIKSSDALAVLFRACLSPAHVKSLAQTSGSEVENLGRDLDELARHQAALRPDIIKLVAATAHDMDLICNGTHMIRNCGPRLCYYNRQGQAVCDEGFPVKVVGVNDRTAILIGDTWGQPQNGDVEMADIENTPIAEVDFKKYLASPTSAEYVTVFSKFLLGFFSNTQQCAPFAETDGVESILKLAFSPSMPLLMNSQLANNRLLRVVQTLIEAKPHLVLPFVLDLLQDALGVLKPYGLDENSAAYFGEFLRLEGQNEQMESSQQGQSTSLLKALQTVQRVCSLLCRALPAHSSRSQSSPLTSINLMDQYTSLVVVLSKLQTKCDFDRAATDAVRKKSPTTPVSAQTSDGLNLQAESSKSATVDPERVELPYSEAVSGKIPVATLEDFNYRQVHHLLYETPNAISRLYAVLGKALLARRPPSSEYSKQNIFMVANTLGQTLVGQYAQFLDNHEEKTALRACSNALERLKPILIDHRYELDRKGPEALTLILRPFKEKGGVEVLGRLLQSMKAFCISLPDEDDRKVTASTAVSTILAFFAAISDKQTILDASQTAHLLHRNTSTADATSPYYFSPAQFIVEVREQITRAVLPIWSAQDIEKLPGRTVRLVAIILKNVLKGDGEVSAIRRNDTTPKRVEPTRRTWALRSQQDLVRLTDSGYLPDLAREALYRCNDNNANAAEYCAAYRRNPALYRHLMPTYDMGEPEPATPLLQSPLTAAQPSAVATPGLANPPLDDMAGPLAEMAQSLVRDSNAELTSPTNTGTTLGNAGNRPDTITLDDLDEVRNHIRTDLVDRCVAMLNAFDNITFEMSDLIQAGVAKSSEPTVLREEITTTLIQSLISFTGIEDLSEHSKKVARSAHLLGIIISDEVFFIAALDELKSNFSVLLGFLSIPQDKTLEQASWVARILLILEFLLAEDAKPKQIQWEPPLNDNDSEQLPPASYPELMVSKDDRNDLFKRILDLLPRVGKDADVGFAFCRMLVLLTRDRQVARKLGEKRNMQKFFVMLKQLSINMDIKFRSSVMIILRHIVEDEETMRQYMRTEIRAIFEKPNPRLDTTLYVHSAAHIVLRAPEIFVEVTNELLELARFDRSQTPQVLVLKKQDAASPIAPSQGETAVVPPTSELPATSIEALTEEKKPAFELKTPSVENPDGVIQYLLSELMTYKDVDDKEAKSTLQQLPLQQIQDVDMSDDSASTTSECKTEDKNSTPDSKPEFKTEEHPIYVYRCFVLQCLTELLASYNRTKVEFINFSRKSDNQAATPSKPRSGVLNYLLNNLLPTGSVQHPEDIAGRKKSCVSSWAISVIVALCSRTPEKSRKRVDSADEEDEPDLAFVRRFVLEHALKAYKDANVSTESFDLKGSRLLSMADLFDRMLAARPASSSPFRRSDLDPASLMPSNKLIAKVMFEKNYIGVLTSSISDVDLTLIGAKRVVKYVLRPLRLLTQTAIELSMSSDSSVSGAGTTDDDDISSATSTSEIGEDREDTPDFYRNSTLGMFEPGREESIDSESEDDEEDDEDEEMYGEQYADDMEYDEDEADNDDVVSDEDEEMEGLGPIEGLSGDMPMHIEVDLDEDGDDDMDEDDEMDEDDDDDDDSDDDDNSEDDDAHLEVMEELENNLADAEEDEDGWEDQGEDDEGVMGYAGADDVEEVIEMLGEPGDEDDESDNDLGAYTGHGALVDPAGNQVLDMDVEDDQLIDESQGDEDEDGEEDYDEDDGYLDGEFEMEDDDAGFLAPGIMPTFGRNALLGRNGPQFRYLPFGGRPDNLMGGYRSHRPADQARPIDNAQNPLLDRTRQGAEGDSGPASRDDAQAARPSLQQPSLRGALDMVLPSGPGAPHDLAAVLRQLAGDHTFPGLDHLIQAVESQPGGGGVSGPLFQAMHQHHHHHGHGAPGQLHPTIHVSMPGVNDPRNTYWPVGTRSPGRGRSDPITAMEFEPVETINRWREEANMLCPGAGMTAKKAALVINAILRLLVPPAMKADKARKEAAEKARKEEEERLRQLAEKEKQERKEREEREAAERAAREAEEAARRAQEAEQSAQTAESGEAMEGVETQAAEATPAAPAEPAQRVMTTIRGLSLDITHLGIDTEFLDALPEEMREEVIMQQVAEQRSQAVASGQEPSTINQDFLNALPADIRNELLQSEAADRRRRDREEARRRASAANNGGRAQAEDMDPASFIAALDDPVLRQSVLADADDDILALLPPDLAAEARRLGGRRRGVVESTLASMGIRADHGAPGRHERTAERAEVKPRRPIVQMMDKSGVATLLRLMFVKLQGSSRNSLNEILRNACGNHQTRGEVVSALLSILQDGTQDASAVERAYSMLALKATQPSSVSKTPQSVKRTANKPALDLSETSPNVVMDHCLHALIFLTSAVPSIPKFFLTEHEVITSAKLKGKGKGKAKDTKSGRYPINSLLCLLEREAVIDSPTVMEHLASLLQILTQPLTTLLKKDKPEAPKEAQQAASAMDVARAIAADDDSALMLEALTALAPEPTQTKVDDKKKELTPPEIPEKSLSSIINVLTARECNGKTFRDTLSTINNLSAIPGARLVFGQELIKRAHELASSIQTDLRQLIQALKGAEDEMDAQSMALANFSPAGSDQAKLNRLLTALDYLFDRNTFGKQSEDVQESGRELLAGLYEDPSFRGLWEQLSGCLSATQQSSERYFLNVATILLPLIESLMVVCKGLALKDGRPLAIKGSAPTTPAPEPAMKGVFFTFTNSHKKILNDLVRQNPKLMSGSFAILVKNAGVLEFDNKRNYFSRRLHYRTAEQRAIPHPALQLNIRRDQVFNDSYRSLFFKKAEEIKYGKLNIRFHGEEGVDAGGVTREWFQVLARQMFNADNALFNPVASDRTTFHPNPLSSINEDHLKYFHFIGRIIGKALYENRVLDCHFSRAVYKRILGKSVSLKDLETIDLEYTKSLRWMLENDITDIITETFSVEKDNFGAIEIVDLIENGRNVAVTDENKHEYVRLVTEYRLTGSVQEQLLHFLQGFHDIVPAELISIFDEGELELLISGMPEIDVDDWKNNADYVNYNVSSSQIQWFWRAVRSFDKEMRAKLLQFVTGTGKVPLNGFKELEGMNGYTRFSIHKDYGDKDRLPSSHTCFNQLDLPEAESYEALRKNLCTAITTGGEYFGFA